VLCWQVLLPADREKEGARYMTSRSGGKKKHIDVEKVRQKKEVKELLRELLQYSADENEFAKLAKSLKPEIGEEELHSLIRLFRDSVREKRGLP
jgi:hypothetical protein